MRFDTSQDRTFPHLRCLTEYTNEVHYAVMSIFVRLVDLKRMALRFKASGVVSRGGILSSGAYFIPGLRLKVQIDKVSIPTMGRSSYRSCTTMDLNLGNAHYHINQIQITNKMQICTRIYYSNILLIAQHV
jgi:hypothetical protein